MSADTPSTSSSPPQLPRPFVSPLTGRRRAYEPLPFMNPNRHIVSAGGYAPQRPYGLEQPRLMAPYRTSSMSTYYGPPGPSAGSPYRMEQMQSAERREMGGGAEYGGDDGVHRANTAGGGGTESHDRMRSNGDHSGSNNESPSTGPRGKKRSGPSSGATDLAAVASVAAAATPAKRNKATAADESHTSTGDASPGAEGQKKRKKAVSCENCRRRKLKCDRGWPCGACRDREEAHMCTWEGGTRPQGTGRDNDNMPLLLRMDKMETLLAQIASHVGVGSEGANGVASSSGGADPKATPTTASNGASFSSRDIDAEPERGRLSVLSTSSLSTGVRATSDQQSMAELIAIMRAMPDTQTIRKLCEHFFNEVNWMHYAVEENQFYQKLREHEEFRLLNTMRDGRLDSKQSLRANLQFVACICAICALALLFSDESEFPEVAKAIEGTPLYGPFFDTALRAFYASNPWEEPTLLSFRILILLMWGIGSVRGPAVGNALLTQAVSQMFALELDTQPAPSMPKAQARDRIRLFHSLVVLDWLSAGLTKRFYLVREEAVKHPYLFDRQSVKEGLGDKDDYLMPDMWLKLEMARINRRAADRAAMTEKDAYAMTIQLQSEIDELFSDLPPDFEAEIQIERTEFELPAFHRLAILSVVANQLINLHKRYYIQGWLDPSYRTSRDICFSSARRICLVLRRVFNHVVPVDELMAMDVEQIQKLMEGRQKLSARLWFFAHSSVGACLLLQHHYALMDVHPDAAGPNAENVRAEIVEDLRYTRRVLLAMSTRSQIARSGIAVLAQPEMACKNGNQAANFVQESQTAGQFSYDGDREEDIVYAADLTRDLQSITDHDSFASKRYRLHGNDSLLSYRSRRNRPSASSDIAGSQTTPPSIGTPSSNTSNSARGGNFAPHGGIYGPMYKDDTRQTPADRSPSSKSFVIPGQPPSMQARMQMQDLTQRQQQHFQQPQQLQHQQAQQQHQHQQQQHQQMHAGGITSLSDMDAFLDSALATDLSTGLPLAPEVSFERQADRIGNAQPFVPNGMMGPMSPFTSAFLGGGWDGLPNGSGGNVQQTNGAPVDATSSFASGGGQHVQQNSGWF